MKPFLSVLVLAVMFAAPIPEVAAADGIGVRTIAVPAPERGTPITVTLWYPAGPGGTPVRVGDNAVFQGTPAFQDAPIASGSFPIILLSQGGLRAAPNLDGWIAARLAADGYFVAAPQPPTVSGQNGWEAPREIWLRPADLSATLTALERVPAVIDRVDVQRVGVLGFQLGATSALALAGARVDAGIYARSCDRDGAGPDCAWFAMHGVDLHKIDTAMVARSNLDPRVRIVVSVDPELAAAFTAESLSAIAIPVHLINLGRAETIRSGLDVAGIERRIPRARYEQVPDATPFDSFSVCKPAGAAILREDGDDEGLCDDGTRTRAAIHEQLAEMIAAAFEQELRSGM